MVPVCPELWTAISQDAASIIGAHIGKRSGPPTPGTGPTPLHACQGECARPALGTEAGLFAFRAPIAHCTATVPLATIAGSPIARKCGLGHLLARAAPDGRPVKASRDEWAKIFGVFCPLRAC